MSLLLPVLPIVVPFLTASLLILVGRSLRLQRIGGVMGAAASMGIALWLLRRVWMEGSMVLQPGSWPAPFGITLVADLFSALMVAVTACVGLAAAIYALADARDEEVSFAFYPLLHILLGGVCGAFLTGDLFNLFVWFEVLLMASFALLVLGGRLSQIEGGLKYLTLNFISSGFFLTALGILYGKTGTLNMADLALKIADLESGAAISSLMLLLAAFGIKAGVFPLFFWLPASYHTPRPIVSAVFAGLLTKVGVYAMMRLFTLLDAGNMPVVRGILLTVAVLTMLTGVLGAASQYNIRKVLSFHIISQIGYMVFGLALFTPIALAATVFYIIHHILVKTNLFLMAGTIEHAKGTGELKQLGGLYRERPWLGVLFLIPALSLAGIPPLSGFFAKLTLLIGALQATAYIGVTAALVAGLLTLFSMTKIWAEAFWKAAPEGAKTIDRPIPWSMLAPMWTMAAITVSIGLNPEWLWGAAQRVATELLDREQYIRLVLGASS